MKKFIVVLFVIMSPLIIAAKGIEPREQKTIHAVQVSETIQINGNLDEPIWQEDSCSDFVQSDPVDGGEPTEKTEIWVAYDEKSLYVAARMHDTHPESITSRLGRRDNFVDSDWFIVSIDPYYDKRTGFQFAVNPAGSFVDWTLYNDGWNDTTWDGVWDCAAQVDDQGWCVEIRIPYNQLRFAKKNEYVWGINFKRVIQRKNENISYVWIPKEDSGYVSHFAKLVGIKGIRPGRHVEFLPYVVGQGRFSPEEQGNPFQTGKSYLGNTGFDLKVGLLSNLTLDATVNPDFGQVEVDPAVVNLSDFETYYQEKRPFFIEGSNIFNEFGRGGSELNVNISWSMPSFFYSRRIGRAPRGDVNRDGYLNYPDRTSILGAFKLSGKIADGWNMSFINAFTAREYAEIDSEGNRFQEEFNEGAQGLGFITTAVIRDWSDDNLADILNEKAFSLAVDGWSFLDKDKEWVVNGWIGGTMVQGSTSSIWNLQRSSLHYYQRPDAAHVSLDPDATSLQGWGGRFILSKQEGNVLVNAAVGVLSPGFDPNDMGFQYGMSDQIEGHFLWGYRQPHPGKIFRNWLIFAGPFRSYDFGGNKTWDGFLFVFEPQLLNYWGFSTMFAYNPKTISNDMTRGGPLVVIPPGRQFDFSFYSDSRQPVVVSASSSYYIRPETDGLRWRGNVSLLWKPRSNISFSFGPGYTLINSKYQWITRVDDELMEETYGTRYIFGRFKQRMLYSEIRLNWMFTPKLSLQLYLQPFLAVGTYDRFKELARCKSLDFNTFGEGQSTVNFLEDEYYVDPDGSGPAEEFSFDNPDFNLKSLRGTIVLRWEYLPGSTLYFVWTQNRADYSDPGDFDFRRDVGNLLSAPGDNIFLLKVSYRWNI